MLSFSMCAYLISAHQKIFQKCPKTDFPIFMTYLTFGHESTLEFAERFEFLNEQMILLSYSGGLGRTNDQDYAGVGQKYSCAIKCHIPIDFTGASGSVDERTTNNVLIAVIGSDEGAVNMKDMAILMANLYVQ